MEQCVNHSGLKADIENLQKEDTEIWKAIEVIRTDVKQLVNRPPVWCTGVISLLTFLLGVAITVAVKGGG